MRSLHEAEPILEGEKWIATKWLQVAAENPDPNPAAAAAASDSSMRCGDDDDDDAGEYRTVR